MNLNKWLTQAKDTLGKADIPTARLDSLILLEDITGKDRSWLLAHPEFEIDKDVLQQLDSRIERRAKHEPLSYIRGKSEFYGREFLITPATLQPRSETETMIELLLSIKGKIIADIGTGSGCIAITAKLELPGAKVHATEISQNALEIAKKNASNLKTDVTFYKANLLEPLLKKVTPDVILANLPYVPDAHTINKAAIQEPKVAIFGGEDGLDLYRELFKQVEQFPEKPKYILTESLPFQHGALMEIAKQQGYLLNKTVDFIQLFKRA